MFSLTFNSLIEFLEQSNLVSFLFLLTSIDVNWFPLQSKFLSFKFLPTSNVFSAFPEQLSSSSFSKNSIPFKSEIAFPLT